MIQSILTHLSSAKSRLDLRIKHTTLIAKSRLVELHLYNGLLLLLICRLVSTYELHITNLLTLRSPLSWLLETKLGPRAVG